MPQGVKSSLCPSVRTGVQIPNIHILGGHSNQSLIPVPGRQRHVREKGVIPSKLASLTSPVEEL